ncbi:MAG: helix-turn-helix transcriptional regulator [Pseudomonadota bacterium]|nr:helix-turn-helix transcriptional regulator [Pseudomonadota bacterium]
MHPGKPQFVQRLQTADAGLSLTMAYGHGEMDGAGDCTVLWLVLRGQVRVTSREGDFILGARDWIALGADSAPQALAGSGALLLGVDLSRAAGRPPLLPGRGRLGRGERRQALAIWRAHGAGLLAFLDTLQADLAAGADRCPGHSQRRKRQVLLRMQRARLCLEGQADGGLRIAELASRINFSPWYFSKVFHAVYGIGPQQFAASMRLERASRLLATTTLPVTEVSAACGFDNPCSFARAFRARFGMTASEHRLRGTR